jgi:aminoglycoside phosphotransferase (APT) family kinase protein
VLAAIRDLVERRFPGCTIVECRRLADDATARGATAKGAGYGVPVRVAFRTADGLDRAVVFHTARPDDFGHDRRADRAAEMLLAFDTYAQIPKHVAALDVGVVAQDGSLRSIADTSEAYLLTEWADGELYADDLRRVAVDGATPRDLHRVDTLADYLVRLHARHSGRLATYTRAVRDLVGSGEGIFGMVDGYAANTPAAGAERLRRIEERALAWRWRLRGRQPRLARIHGDFHPFNILFTAQVDLALLDASRGAVGDPADDLTALAINYVFFALDQPGAWRRGLGALWHRLWTRYLRSSGDHELLDVAAPWLAWRALVIANPTWYPSLSEHGRDRLLSWIERALDMPRFDPASADEVPP